MGGPFFELIIIHAHLAAKIGSVPAYLPTRLPAIFHTHADAFRIVASQSPTIGSW
jgi:hypothetical protein